MEKAQEGRGYHPKGDCGMEDRNRRGGQALSD